MEKIEYKNSIGKHQFHCWNILKNSYNTTSCQGVNVGKCIPYVDRGEAQYYGCAGRVAESKVTARCAATNGSTVDNIHAEGDVEGGCSVPWNAEAGYNTAITCALCQGESGDPCHDGADTASMPHWHAGAWHHRKPFRWTGAGSKSRGTESQPEAGNPKGLDGT